MQDFIRHKLLVKRLVRNLPAHFCRRPIACYHDSQLREPSFPRLESQSQPWRISKSMNEPSPNGHRELIDAYLAGPRQLREAIAGMTAEQLNATPVPGKWSTRQVICHLADFEPVYVDRITRVIAEDRPTMFGGDPDLFAARLSYEKRDLQVELAMIDSLRQHLATILKAQPSEVFLREGNHSEAGPISLERLLKSVTAHIPHHVTFIREKRQALGLS